MRIAKELALAIVLLLCLAAAALAETARVQTPGGPVNMRKKPSAKASVVAEAPNRALVEALETDGEWTKIAYKNKTGYVKTEFLLLSSALAGKTVYPDGAFALAYTAPAEDAALLTPVNGDEAVRVTAVKDGWAEADFDGKTGYIPVAQLSRQLETPSGEMGWIAESARTVAECALMSRAKDGQALAALPVGEAVTATLMAGDACLVICADGCGYVPAADLCLDAWEDAPVAALDGLTPNEAAARAEAALRKKFRDFGKTRLYSVVAPHGDVAYACAFFDDDDRHLYSAVITSAGDAACCAAYTAFAAPARAAALLPDGQMDVALSADTLAVGDVLDITVTAWTAHQCRYELTGPVPAASEPGGHFSAAWRPRQAGDYALTVTVTDEAGRSESQTRALTVTAGDAAAEALYSQKDGWWLDKPYRHSTLDQSGCAIFTLSHALNRMGKTGAETTPESLARAFALCLTPDGTNNERLIREAAAAFGFGTQSALIKDEKQLRAHLRDGDMFSFSIARGHIALAFGVSEDGTMVRVADSAPLATFERIVNDSLYYRLRSGSFRAATRMDDLPGARWYFETDDYGGMEYWLRTAYVAKRGGRLIERMNNEE